MVNNKSPALRRVFGGQTAPGLPPYECNAQIICIWHLDHKSNNSKILETNRKEREEDISKRTKSIALTFFCKEYALRVMS